MAKLNPVNSLLLGQLGPVVVSSWKGIPYVKSKYKKRTKKITKTEKANRNKFAEAHLWLQPLLEVVRIGFRGYTPTVEGFLAAKSYLLKNAFEGSPLKLTINPSLVRISAGDVELSGNITVQKTKDKQLLFSWDTSPLPNGGPNDHLLLVAYDIENKNVIYDIGGQLRKAGSHTLQLANKKGRTYHIYLAFIDSYNSRQSNSTYLGTVDT